MKALHIFGILNRGGAELRTYEFLKRNARENLTCDFIVLTGRKGDMDEDFLEVGKGRIYYMKLGAGFFPKYIALLRKNRYDAVHSHVLLVSALFLLLARLLHVPVRIAHLRSTSNKSVSTVRVLRDRLLKKLMLSFSTHIVCVSESVAEAIWGGSWKNLNRVEVVYNGFELIQNDDATPDSVFRIGHIGRFHQAKNHKFLAGIYKALCAQNDGLQCTMTGRFDEIIYPEIREMLAPFCVSEQVVIQNQKNDIRELLRSCDIIISTSLWEGLPGTVIEAVSCGVPVIASAIAPNREVARHTGGIQIIDGWDESNWVKEIQQAMGKIRSHKKIEIRSSIQDAFKQSPFYYTSTDQRLLDIYHRAENSN